MLVAGRYRLVEEIGRGDGTVVWKALDATDNRVVAVKLFPPTASRRGMAALAAEMQAERARLAKLNHPSIVPVLDAGIDDARPFVVHEHIEGRTLAQAIERGDLTQTRKARIARLAAEALAFAHRNGFLHLRLRPSNILLSPDGSVRLSDFGFTDLGAGSQEVTPLPSTLLAYYRAPEQIYGHKCDERTDLFSFGAIIYELLLGRRPFDGRTWIEITQKVLNAEPAMLRDSSAQLPVAFIGVLTRCLAKNPLDRYQSSTELADDLRRIESSLLEVSAAVEATSPPHEPPSQPALRPFEGPCLLVEEGAERRIVPLGGDEFTIGRRLAHSLPLMNLDTISRDHARIVREDGRFRLEDWRSKHGVFVNGNRIERVLLSDGDRIELGGQTERVRLLFRTGERRGLPPEPTPAPDQSSLLESHPLLSTILDVAKAICSSPFVDDVLNLIVDAAQQFTSAERGFIMLRDGDRFAMRVARPTARQEDLVSFTVVQRAVSTGQTVFFPHLPPGGPDPGDSIEILNLAWAVALPLVVKGEVNGALYLDSRQGGASTNSLPMALLEAFASFAAIALDNARLYEAAIVDQLTQTFRRHHGESNLQNEWHRATRHGSPLSVIFLDVDNFKQVNDLLGFEAGDQTLRAVARVLKEHARGTDQVVRWGGEEFLVIAPETRCDAALSLAERIRAAIEAAPIDAGDAPVHVTASLGVATYPDHGPDSWEGLVAQANEAERRAKSEGKNRVASTTPGPRPGQAQA